MIRKLQKRFIVIAMGSFFAALCLVLAAVNCVYLHGVHAKLDERLVYLAAWGGVDPLSGSGNFNREGMSALEPSAEPSGEPSQDVAGSLRELMELRYFIVSSDQSEQAQEYNLRFISSVSSADARRYLDRVLSSGRSFGYCDDFRYYAVPRSDGGYTAVFLYCRDELDAARSLRWTSVGVMLLGLALIFVLVLLLSRRAIEPIAAGIERQKQFITDASHELKTPLGVLAANNDVLALEGGENEWIESSRRQIRRLAGLTENLVMLSRLDERRALNAPELFCVSACTEEALTDFTPQAEQKRLAVERDVAPELYLRGDEAGFRQLAGILLDNAVRYSPPGGWLRVQLRRRPRGAVLEVSNGVDVLPAQPLDRLFDRFYRGDSARSADGGYGVGLSIAKTMAETLGWELSVHSDDGRSLRFTAEL